MKKLLSIALSNLQDESNGVSLKIKMQLNAFEANEIEPFCIAYGNDGCYIYTTNSTEKLGHYRKFMPRRITLFINIINHLKKNRYEIGYIRFPHCDFLFIKILKKLKQQNSKIYLEIPSYPIVYSKNNINNMLYCIFDTIHKRRLKEYVFRCVSIGENTKSIFGIKNVNIPNGICIDSFPKWKYRGEKNLIKIISVSNMFYPHGYDRLVHGLANYYSEKLKDDPEIYLYMVGEGPEKKHLEKMSIDYGISEFIKFCGKMSGKPLDELFNSCNMACGPLAIHRKGTIIASPLKTKEYFARGIPFIYAYEEISLSTHYPYALRLIADENAINFKHVVDFYNSYINRINEVTEDMRTFAEGMFSLNNILKFIA